MDSPSAPGRSGTSPAAPLITARQLDLTEMNDMISDRNLTVTARYSTYRHARARRAGGKLMTGQTPTKGTT
jgi:hypothetical protein